MQELKEKISGEITMSSDPGMAIRKWRSEFKVSQHKLAGQMGISHSVISDYESGRRKSPGINFIKRLVDTLVEIDVENGSHVISRFKPDRRLDCIIDMGEFSDGLDEHEFIKLIQGTKLNQDKIVGKRKIYGYTVIDSVKAILSLGSEDYLKIYGWSIERALIFTNVHFGRSPMVAIRAHPLTPAMVVYQNPAKVDELAIKLADLEGIPLVSTKMTVNDMVKNIEHKKTNGK